MATRIFLEYGTTTARTSGKHLTMDLRGQTFWGLVEPYLLVQPINIWSTAVVGLLLMTSRFQQELIVLLVCHRELVRLMI